MILKATELASTLGTAVAAVTAAGPRRFAAATTAAVAPPLPTSLAFAACAPLERRFPPLRLPCFFSAMIYCEFGGGGTVVNIDEAPGQIFFQGIPRTLSRDLSRTIADMLIMRIY
jgi:hypothetical protein